MSEKSVNHSIQNVVRELDPGMGRAVAERTVLRRKESGEFESWSDVARRVAIGNSLLEPREEFREIERNLLEKHIAKGVLLMSGRHLQHGDENQPSRSQEVFTNCSTSATSFLLFYLLLNGSGVGRSYDDDMMLVNWDNAPNIRCVLDASHPDFDFSAHESARDAKHKYGDGEDVLWFEVPDSREGWAKALEIWENAAFEKIHKDKLLILDFSKVRAKGTPIGGMQNRPASGPVPIMNAFMKAASLKGSNISPWKQAIFVDHYFAECVLVGGARRAARLAVKNWRDKTIFDYIRVKRPIEYNGKKFEDVQEMRKNGHFWGFLWSSNNSVGVDEEFWELVSLSTKDPLYQSDRARHARKVFKVATECAYGDGTGEPGFVSVHKLSQNLSGWTDLNRGDYVGSGRFQINDDTQILMSRLAKRAKKKKYVMITNPCVTGETMILTDKGNFPISDLVGKKVNIWNGKEWSEVVPFSTGRNEILRVELSNGTAIRCTPYHKFILAHPDQQYRDLGFEGNRVEAKDLEVGDILWRPNVSVLSVEREIGKKETFCFTDPKNNSGTFNGIVTANCGEIALNLLGGYCVIADVVPYHADTLEEAEEAFRAVTRALIRVNLMDSTYRKEVQRTNRIGVGMTGVHEFAWKFFGYGFRELIDENKSKDFWETLRRFNRVVNEEAIKYSNELGLNNPHTTMTVKPAGCRPWYSLTTTDQGILTLEEIFVDHPIGEKWAEMKENMNAIQDENPKRITRTYHNGKSKLISIRMNYGLTVQSTPEHKWFVKYRSAKNMKSAVVFDDWLPASEIRPDDVLDVRLGVYQKDTDVNLRNLNSLSFNMREDYRDSIVQPESMNPELAWFIGYLWGNGAMSPAKYRLRFMDRNPEKLRKVSFILEKHFNLNVDHLIRSCSDRDACHLEFGNKFLWHWLIKNNIWKYDSEERIDLIPSVVRRSSKETIIAFIAGMFDADGCVSSTGGTNVATFSQACPRFAMHFQDVSWAVGLGFGMSHNKIGQNFQKRKSMYLMTLGCAVDEHSFSLFKKHSIKVQGARNDLRWRHEGEKKNSAIVGKVLSLYESEDVVETYDIEVEESHWFYAGAVKSHNSTSKLFALSEGWHLPSMRYYLRWVQFRNDDPLVESYEKLGYPVRKLKTYEGTTIVGFPTAPTISRLGMGDKLVTAGEATPEEQYKWLMLGEKYWINGDFPEQGNQISYTMKYVPEIVDYQHFKAMLKRYQSQIKCCSVMPQSETVSFEYQPEEPITKEKYDELMNNIKQTVKEDVDKIHVDCDGGACPIDFYK